jgi:hypothetical protein
MDLFGRIAYGQARIGIVWPCTEWQPASQQMVDLSLVGIYPLKRVEDITKVPKEFYFGTGAKAL